MLPLAVIELTEERDEAEGKMIRLIERCFRCWMSRSSVSVDGDRLPLLVPARVCIGLRDLWDRSRSPGEVGCGSALTDALVLACSPEPPKVELNRQKTHTKKAKVNLCNSNDIRLKEYWLNNHKVETVFTVRWCHTDLPRGRWGQRRT